jgi:hypothetical protein
VVLVLKFVSAPDIANGTNFKTTTLAGEMG